MKIVKNQPVVQQDARLNLINSDISYSKCEMADKCQALVQVRVQALVPTGPQVE